MKSIKVSALALTLSVLASAAPAHAAMTRASAENLMRSGKSMKCDMNISESGVTQKGTVYISGGKMRGDFDVAQPGEGTFQAHVLQDGDWAYTWGGPMGEVQGTKMRVDRSGGPGNSQTFNQREEMDMDCSEWRPDAAKFGVPSGIQFMDINMSGMNGMGAGPMMGGAGMQQMQCQACDQMPVGQDRDMCRQMLGCS